MTTTQQKIKSIEALIAKAEAEGDWDLPLFDLAEATAETLPRDLGSLVWASDYSAIFEIDGAKFSLTEGRRGWYLLPE